MKTNRTCRGCSRPLGKLRSQWCQACRMRRSADRRADKARQRQCDRCGQPFAAWCSHHRYCSAQCRKADESASIRTVLAASARGRIGCGYVDPVAVARLAQIGHEPSESELARGYCPTPLEIAAACAAIRESWSEAERQRRASPAYRRVEAELPVWRLAESGLECLR